MVRYIPFRKEERIAARRSLFFSGPDKKAKGNEVQRL
jgi:hypothetical protein